jgi:hypothetical protein
VVWVYRGPGGGEGVCGGEITSNKAGMPGCVLCALRGDKRQTGRASGCRVSGIHRVIGVDRPVSPWASCHSGCLAGRRVSLIDSTRRGLIDFTREDLSFFLVREGRFELVSGGRRLRPESCSNPRELQGALDDCLIVWSFASPGSGSPVFQGKCLEEIS